MKERKWWETDSAFLHLLAMALMLSDHMWATLPLPYEWMTNIGRLAFPIFAFMTAEGYAHTKNLKKYAGRLLVCALISEIPFNLMMGGELFYPYHQNVIWTFLIGLGAMYLLDTVRKKLPVLAAVLLGAVIVIAAAVLGYAAMVDYYGAGVLTVLTFYLLRGDKHWQRLLRLAALWFINVKLLGGYYFELSLFGHTVEVVQQGLALLALIPIELYRGRQGYHSKAFQYFCYGFYPVHMAVLVLISSLL